MSLIKKIASGGVDWRFVYRKWVLGIGGRHGSPRSEVQVKRFLKTLPRGDVFVDVGANVGDYSVLLHKKFQLTIAVEPFPETMKALRKRVSGTGVVSVDAALCDFDGETTLYLNQDGVRCNGSADTIEPLFHYRPASSPLIDKTWKQDHGITVRAQRFDSLIEAFIDRDYRIDLVKVDVEGAEFRVLEGARDSLRGRIKRVVVELHDRERKNELEDILLNYGFFTHWIDLDHIYGSKPI